MIRLQSVLSLSHFWVLSTGSKDRELCINQRFTLGVKWLNTCAIAARIVFERFHVTLPSLIVIETPPQTCSLVADFDANTLGLNV